MNYTDRVKELMPPSLSRANRVEVLTIIKEMAKCGKIKLFTIQRASRTRGYNQKIFKKQTYVKSLSQKVINDCYNLSVDEVNFE